MLSALGGIIATILYAKAMHAFAYTIYQQKKEFLGMKAFFKEVSKQIISKLPVSNTLLESLGCLNPEQKDISKTVKSIKTAAEVYPKQDSSNTVDEWKFYKMDTSSEAPAKDKRVDYYWRDVFKMKKRDENFWSTQH